jgi:uncharacterized membrane protein YccF (DUF307 family)
MRTLGNIIWHIPFLGFVTAFLAFLLGSLLVLTVIASPIGLGLLEYAKFLLKPFGSTMMDKKDLNRPVNPVWNLYSTIIMLFYLPFGIILCLITLCQIIPLFFSIVGIPVAAVLAKSLGTLLNPVNKICVPSEVTTAIRQRKASEKYSQD